MTDEDIENVVIAITIIFCIPLFGLAFYFEHFLPLVVYLLMFGNLYVSWHFYIKWYSQPMKENSLDILLLYLISFSLSFLFLPTHFDKYWKDLGDRDESFDDDDS